jgi:putative phosphoribosyl transferase
MLFKDRAMPGKRLAEELSDYKGRDGSSYTLPRGGVILGYEIASNLSIPLDLIITRKIWLSWKRRANSLELQKMVI